MYFTRLFWIASHSNNAGQDKVFYTHSAGMLRATYYTLNNACGFYPLVCLNSNVHLVLNEDGQTYSLEVN